MLPCIDLHTHSTASDGTLTPTQLVERAAAAGLDGLALTDHDTLSGVAEAQAAAQRLGIHCWSGVEVSVSWNKTTIHLVGLRVDTGYGPLNEGLQELQTFRHWRAEEMGRRLAKSGIQGAYEGAKALSGGSLIGRAHFARFLVQRGYVAEERKVYRKYLTQGRPGHVAGCWAGLKDAVEWICGAGGWAVIAHPARYRLSQSKMRRLLREFVDAGGQGLEVVSGSHSKDECFTMARLAQQFDLMASMGSDYHGPQSHWLELGKLPALPAGLRPIWQDW